MLGLKVDLPHTETAGFDFIGIIKYHHKKRKD
jgi:hypothetical protein